MRSDPFLVCLFFFFESYFFPSGYIQPEYIGGGVDKKQNRNITAGLFLECCLLLFTFLDPLIVDPDHPRKVLCLLHLILSGNLSGSYSHILLLYLACNALIWSIAFLFFSSFTLGLDVLELPLLPGPTPALISDFDSNSPLIRALKVQKNHTHSNTSPC